MQYLRHVARAGLIAATLVLLPHLAAGAGDKKEMVITQKDDKSTVKVTRGERLAIKLSGLPSAGYTWQVAKNNADVLAYSGKVEIEKGKPGVIGGQQVMVLRFTARAAGTSDVELHYRRPFEKDKAPAKTYRLKVEVTDD